MSKGIDSAFPVPFGEAGEPVQTGLTKRELFAVMIAQGIAARGPVEGEADPSIEGRCRHAVRVADALLAELAKEGKSETKS